MAKRREENPRNLKNKFLHLLSVFVTFSEIILRQLPSLSRLIRFGTLEKPRDSFTESSKIFLKAENTLIWNIFIYL